MGEFLFELLLELLAGVFEGIIPERLHTTLITGITAAAGTMLLGIVAYAVLLAATLASRMEFGAAWGALFAGLLLAGPSACCLMLTTKGFRALRSPSR